MIRSVKVAALAESVAPCAKPPEVLPTIPVFEKTGVSHWAFERRYAITVQPPPAVLISQYTLKATPLPAPSGSIRYTPLGADEFCSLIDRQLVALRQVPPAQTLPEGHAVPQPPQLVELVRVSTSQPLVGLPSQSA